MFYKLCSCVILALEWCLLARKSNFFHTFACMWVVFVLVVIHYFAVALHFITNSFEPCSGVEREHSTSECMEESCARLDSSPAQLQLQIHELQSQIEHLRSYTAFLEQRLHRIEQEDQRVRRDLRGQRSTPSIGCLSVRLLHLEGCFSFLVRAVQTSFPRPPGFWQSLIED